MEVANTNLKTTLWQSNRIELTIDLIFAALLLILYLIFRIYPSIIYIENLLIASYLCLGLSALFFFLIFDMNQKLASILHIGTFPILSIIFLFQRWLPEATSQLGSVKMVLSIFLLVYVLMMVSFLDAQLYLYWKRKTNQTS